MSVRTNCFSLIKDKLANDETANNVNERGGGGASTLRRSVSGKNYSGNLKILSGIGRLGKFSGRQEVMK